MTGAELKARYDKAVQERAVAEAKRESAEAQLRAIIDKIKERFGVESVPEAETKLKELQEELHTLSGQIEKELDAVQY